MEDRVGDLNDRYDAASSDLDDALHQAVIMHDTILEVRCRFIWEENGERESSVPEWR